jgi:hypothetical protein
VSPTTMLIVTNCSSHISKLQTEACW